MKKIFRLFLLMFILCMVAGCKEETQENEYRDQNIDIYYINRDETTIRSEKYEIQSSDISNAIEEVLAKMKEAPEKAELKAAPFSDIVIHSIRLEETILTLDLDEKYKSLPYTTEVLVRAAIVKTLTQISGIEFVSIEVGSVPLTDSAGEVLGLLAKEQFVDNPEGQISNNAQANFVLYFADKDGTGLVPVQRYAEYNTNIPPEKLVAEMIIQGPSAGEDAYPVINPNTKVVSIIMKDRTCYLNLDENFLTQVYSVNSEVTIYSLVNSIIALNNVNKVQISVNGKTEVTYMESISLTNYFERNLDLVRQQTEGTVE